MIKKSVRLLIYAGFVLALSGCFETYHWYKAGSTQQSSAADISECQMASARAYPYVEGTVVTQQGYRTQGQTQCNTFGNQVLCNTEPSQYVAPKGYTVDRNEEARTSAYNNCMRGKGYVLRRDEDKRAPSSQQYEERNRLGGTCRYTSDCGGVLVCKDTMCMERAK